VYRAHDSAATVEPIPALVTLDVWGVDTRAVPRAFTRMGLDRRTVRSLPSVTFAKLLGTGSGASFTTRDADLNHWAILTCWANVDSAASFKDSAVPTAWKSIAHEHARFEMKPLSSRGTWSGRQPFGDPIASRWNGPIAAITRARIKPTQWVDFWRSVPRVSADLDQLPGVVFRLGIGEAPLGLQGTFSVWQNNAALSDFAHRRSPHREVIERTHATNWYAEELFARFALTSASGSFEGKPVNLPVEGR